MKALELLERMGGRGLTPDVISFTSAMSACVKAGEWQVTPQRLLQTSRDALEPLHRYSGPILCYVFPLQKTARLLTIFFVAGLVFLYNLGS